MYLEPEHRVNIWNKGVETVLVLSRIELTFLGLRGSTARGPGLDWSLEFFISYDVMLSI